MSAGIDPALLALYQAEADRVLAAVPPISEGTRKAIYAVVKAEKERLESR